MVPVVMEKENTLCGKCEIIVNNDENVLLCDGFCRSWFHAKCVGIDDESYRKISDLRDKVWYLCGACVRRIGNTKSYVCDTDEYINLDDLVGSLFKVVKDLSNDNVLINKKLDEVSLINKELATCIYSLKPEMVHKPENFLSSAADLQDADF